MNLSSRARRNARGPQTQSFQKNPSEENTRRNPTEGENKVECKKWSAKGTYRKASADREPTTHPNTLGGQRPRADTQGASAHSAGPGFFCLSVCGVVGLWGCGVVGLWCVCVCVFYWPRGSQKASKICSVYNFYQNRTKMGPTSTTNETNLGQGGVKGQPKINENMKKYVVLRLKRL